MIQVEDDNGELCSVDFTNNHCSCGGLFCKHLQKASAFYKRSKIFLFQAYSGFHKELRRGDTTRALQWGHVLSVLSTREAMLYYLQKVVFEETRDLSLWLALKTASLSLEEAITRFCAVRKKWELDGYSVQHMSNWAAGLRRFENGTITSLDQSLCDLDHNRDLSLAYAVVFWMREEKANRTEFWAAVKRWSRIIENESLQRFLTLTPKRSYEALVFLEYALGVHDMSSLFKNEKQNSVAGAKIVIPSFRSYYLDNHVYRGATILKSKWSAYSNDPYAVHEKLDLRMSGLVTSTLWRSLAFAQYGLKESAALTEIQWDRVLIPIELWRDCARLDEYYYPKLRRH